MNPPPVPFGDPTVVNQQNSQQVKKGVLVGCSGCAVLAGLAVAFFVGLFFVIIAFMGKTDVVSEAVAKAKTSPELREILGPPIEKGLLMTGSISTSGSSGNADVKIPLSGSKRSAVMHAVATMADSHWVFSTLTVKVDGSGEEIDLLAPPRPSAPAQ